LEQRTESSYFVLILFAADQQTRYRLFKLISYQRAIAKLEKTDRSSFHGSPIAWTYQERRTIGESGKTVDVCAQVEEGNHGKIVAIS
jgi:hypothetical protein